MKQFFRVAFLATLLSFTTGIALASSSLSNITLNISGGTEVNTTAPSTPTATAVTTGANHILAAVYCYNSNATPVYLHFYNLGTGSITIGTTSATVVYGCPGNTAGAGFVEPIFIGIAYSTAISYYVSGGISRTDNTSITASTVIVDAVFQ